MASSEPPKKNPFAEIGTTKIKLKKTKNINDKSGPKLTGFISEEQVAEYDKYIKSFDIESWYETLKDITFPTEYVRISFEEGQNLHALCEDVIKLKKAIAIAEKEEEQKELTEQIRKLDTSKLSDLASRIDAVINKWRPKLVDDGDEKERENENENGNVNDDDFGVFAKLSSRSAKDATDAEERLQALFKKYCLESNAKDDNDRVRELLKAATHCMKVSNAKQIISMFMNSERIHHDLGSALKYGKDKFDQNVVLRKWIPIDIDMEFRGFVCNGKLNALSQYNHFIFFERLVKMEKELVARIQDFFEKNVMKKLSHYEGYIVDFAVCDAGLFSWKKEKELLQNGPFEFRIKSEKPKEQMEIEYKYRVLLGWEK